MAILARRVLLGGLLAAAAAAHVSVVPGHLAQGREILRRCRLPVDQLRRENLPGDLHDFLSFCRENLPADASFLLLTPDRYLFGVRRFALSPRRAITYRPEWRGGDVDRALLEGRGPKFVVVYLASNHVPGSAPAFEAFERKSLATCRGLLGELESSGIYGEIARMGPGRRILHLVEKP